MPGAYRIPLPPGLTETQFQTTILELARSRCWVDYHTLDSRGSQGGWPDLVLIRPPQLLFVELKAPKGRVSALQQFWLDGLGVAGVDARLWRPADWDEIVDVLGTPPTAAQSDYYFRVIAARQQEALRRGSRSGGPRRRGIRG